MASITPLPPWAPSTGGTVFDRSLRYHAEGPPGKLTTGLTKPLRNADDLSLAYSPGVAEAVRAIARDPAEIYRLTGKGNLVAVASNGTGILGEGNLGAAAFIPVGEGKVALFKTFGDINGVVWSFDTTNPDELIRAIQMLAPLVGGINLEDIAAPHCFYVERELKRLLDIPVFHDDQHGTATVVAAGLLNAMEVQGKQPDQMKIVFNGAGAAAIAIAKLQMRLGLRRSHIFMTDSKGVVTKARTSLNPSDPAYIDPRSEKAYFAQAIEATKLAEILPGADLLITVGKSGDTELTDNELKSLAQKPIIFALENPSPKVSYTRARSVCPDAVVFTGRSDDPNQANNVLGFPFLFRGALDVWAREINKDMQLAAARALALLAREAVPDEVRAAYEGAELVFGPEYLIPKIFDRRAFRRVPLAVASAAIASGVARRKFDSEEAYTALLDHRLAQMPQFG